MYAFFVIKHGELDALQAKKWAEEAAAAAASKQQ